MEFRIAATFTESLARLTAQEQKAVKTTAFDLQMDASAPGLSFHKLDRAVDKNFWSVRVNADIRLIVHRGDASLLLAYVDHHDKAYRWAVFLHPAQRALVERRFAGPARVTGSAGTGKTIVALHRAVHLARRHPKARVLLTTFSKPLAKRAGSGNLNSWDKWIFCLTAA
jgi:mRNA-degrading endonuclease RelE of RelBE toxin-antitoxin system